MWQPTYLTNLEPGSLTQEIILQPLCHGRLLLAERNNLLWPRDLREFTRLQQELLCLQTSPRRTHLIQHKCHIDRPNGKGAFPPWIQNISGVGLRESHPVQDSTGGNVKVDILQSSNVVLMVYILCAGLICVWYRLFPHFK